MKEKVLIGIMFGLLAGMVLAQSGGLPPQTIQFIETRLIG